MSHLERIAAVVIPLILAAQPVPAETPPVRIMVPYDDLDLSRQTGAQAILWRLRSAVSRACGEQFTAHDPAVRSSYRYCLRRNMTDAVARLGAPLVQALHDRPFVREAMGE